MGDAIAQKGEPTAGIFQWHIKKTVPFQERPRLAVLSLLR